MRKDAFSYGTETVLVRTDSNTITYHYGFFIRACYFDNYQSLAADLPGPVNNTRTGTDITDKIRSLRIGRINTEDLSAASAAYVTASVTYA